MLRHPARSEDHELCTYVLLGVVRCVNETSKLVPHDYATAYLPSSLVIRNVQWYVKHESRSGLLILGAARIGAL